MNDRRDFLLTGCCALAAMSVGVAASDAPLALAAETPAAARTDAPADPARFARERFLYHYNCTIAVLEAFAPAFGAPVAHIRRLASPFAAGMWLGKTCGALTGAMMVLGLAHGRSGEKDADADAAMPARIKELFALVRAEFGDNLDCSALLGVDMGSPEGVKKAASLGLFQSVCPRLVYASARAAEKLVA